MSMHPRKKCSYLYHYQLQSAKCTKAIITKKQTNKQSKEKNYKNNRTKNPQKPRKNKQKQSDKQKTKNPGEYR